MDADERGLKNPKPIVWKPTPDMYRMDTPEGREAYEASLRSTASEGGAGGHPTPARAKAARSRDPVIAPEERAETYAVLG